MPRTNKDKDNDPEIESVLDETPPDINEPIAQDKEESEIVEDAIADPENEEPVTPEPEPVEDKVTPVIPIVEPLQETPEQREQRYKSQQSEAQIQSERNRALTEKVEEAAKVSDPTPQELKDWMRTDGVEWDELTTFEQAMAKKTYISERKFSLVHEAVEGQKKIDSWAQSIDTFIDSTNGKPEYIDLSSHEADFRKFAMKEAHRGAPIDILVSSFMYNLPKDAKKKGSIFETGGGGDKVEHKDGITDADQVANLRKNDPREYARQLKAGKIKLDI